MAIYDINQSVRLTGSFTVSDVATDPTTVTFDYRKPGGTQATWTYGTDAEVVKSSTGVYYVDLTLDTAGEWYYQWNGAGTVVATGSGRVYVRRDTV